MSTARIALLVWRLLDRRLRRRLVALQLVSVLMAATTVSGVAAILPFLTVLAEPELITRNAVLRLAYQRLHFGSEHAFVIALGISFAAAVVLSNAVNLLGSLALYRFSRTVADALHLSLYEEYLRRDYGFHSNTHSSVLAGKVIYETGRVGSGILQSGLTLVSLLITMLFMIASMLLLNPLLAASLIGALGASYAAVYLATRNRLLRNGVIESRSFAARSKIVAESFAAIRDIIMAQAQGRFLAEFAACCRPISESLASAFAISQWPRHAVEMAAVCSLVAAALYLSGGERASPWIAQLSFVALAGYRLLPALQQAFTAMVRIRCERPAFENIVVDLLMARTRETPQPGNWAHAREPASAAPAPWSGVPRRDIRLQSISFWYEANRPAAIADITLCIEAGSTVGFMGANGSGKTTLGDVLAGLIVPQMGQMEVDGTALDEAGRVAWRTTVAYVPQHIVLLDATLAENIAFGAEPSRIDGPRLRDAVRLARLEECVASLPKRYEEMLGERGCRLSGGHRQRLGIARALYRDASVIILDEATSALDAAAEEEIVDVLGSLGRGRTVLLIAHRLSSLRHCDVIFELQDGRIVRGGTKRAHATPPVHSMRRPRP